MEMRILELLAPSVAVNSDSIKGLKDMITVQESRMADLCADR